MTQRFRQLTLAAAVAGLALANLAMFHNPGSQGSVWWKNYRWDKSRLGILVNVSSASRTPALRAANTWIGRTDLELPSSSSHTDISLYDGNWGDNGWAGLATVWTSFLDSDEIDHCHARLNRYYTHVPTGQTTAWWWEGVYCQELGHCFGLGHDLTTGCMNAGAMWRGLANTPSSSNVSAINGRY
jgi:predicted Zn-dependent protease